MPDPSPTVNIQQAVELTGVSRRSIYNWVAANKVEYFKSDGVGGLRIVRATLFKAIDAEAQAREFKKAQAAHRLVSRAVKRGDLVRQPCEECGSVDVEGHHDDYDKPLEVRWLCQSHHRLHHAERRRAS